MRIGLLTLDQDGRIDFFNGAATQILGYGAQDARGKPCEEIFTGLADVLAHLGGADSSIKPGLQSKTNALHKDGHELSLIVSPYVTREDDGDTRCHEVVLLFQSAEELEGIEGRLQHLNKLQSLDQFAAGIVHEIRNPLTGISTNAQHLIEQIGPKGPFREEMQDILADVQAIEQIVSKVLDFAHPSKSCVRKLPIEDTVEEVLKLSRLRLRRQGIQLSTDLCKSPVKVNADVSQMKQVLFNIVRNACEAMPDGGELRVSTAKLRAGGKQVRVVVEDTGHGIAEEFLDHIFNPFFTMHRQGTGLGLAISRRIIENHGGQIDVESVLGKGTKFGISLPAI